MKFFVLLIVMVANCAFANAAKENCSIVLAGDSNYEVHVGNVARDWFSNRSSAENYVESLRDCGECKRVEEMRTIPRCAIVLDGPSYYEVHVGKVARDWFSNRSSAEIYVERLRDSGECK